MSSYLKRLDICPKNWGINSNSIIYLMYFSLSPAILLFIFYGKYYSMSLFWIYFYYIGLVIFLNELQHP